MAIAEWMSLLACPVCCAALTDTQSCRACGEVFQHEDATPRLMSDRAKAAVSFTFTSPRSVVSGDLKRRVLAWPTTELKSDLPYHMDPAHAALLAGKATTPAPIPRGALVLEIGCGGGQNRAWMTKHGLRYLGTDVSKTRVYEFLQKFGGPDLLCDAHFLPFRDACVDVVYAAAVNEHLACPLRAAQEARRVLKPGGYYLGNCSFMEPWHDESFFHMSPNAAIELLTAAELDIVNVYPGRGWHGFKALPRMAFQGPFRALAPLGSIFHAVYQAQTALANMRRKSQGRSPHDATMTAAKVAGAMTWIARKPG